MAKLDLLIQAWDEGHREFAIALEGLSDEDLWRRAHPRLLSVGELAGHITYYEAIGHIAEDSSSQIVSPLADPAFRYYTDEVEKPVVFEMGVDELLKEVARVHEESKRVVLELDPDAADKVSSKTFAGWSWAYYLQYRVFHIAYHTGQIYSVRHLLGHSTTDN